MLSSSLMPGCIRGDWDYSAGGREGRHWVGTRITWPKKKTPFTAHYVQHACAYSPLDEHTGVTKYSGWRTLLPFLYPVLIFHDVRRTAVQAYTGTGKEKRKEQKNRKLLAWFTISAIQSQETWKLQYFVFITQRRIKSWTQYRFRVKFKTMYILPLAFVFTQSSSHWR